MTSAYCEIYCFESADGNDVTPRVRDLLMAAQLTQESRRNRLHRTLDRHGPPNLAWQPTSRPASLRSAGRPAAEREAVARARRRPGPCGAGADDAHPAQACG